MHWLLFFIPRKQLTACYQWAQFSQAVGCSGCPPPLSASACDRSKRRRFGCRRTAKLRALTCGGCLNGEPWLGVSSTARRRLLRAQVAPKDSHREAFGDAGCRARFFADFLAVQQESQSPAGARPGQQLHAMHTMPVREIACFSCGSGSRSADIFVICRHPAGRRTPASKPKPRQTLVRSACALA